LKVLKLKNQRQHLQRKKKLPLKRH